MHHTHDTSLFTTLSGMLGGLLKAITAKPLLVAISLGSLAHVMLYAAASASVGYVVKRSMDAAIKHFFSKNPKTDQTKEENE